MGANVGGLQGVIRAIVGRGVDASKTTDQTQRRRRNVGRDTFLGGIQPFGGGQRRGGGLFGGAASTAAQQTFGT
jgi:hypothetical protein